MDRRFLFPVLAVTAWSQQTSPAAADTERALRARVEQFFHLEVDGKFRAAEAFVAEESKDYFYDSTKPSYLGVTYGSAAFSDNYTRATVTTKVKTQLFFPAAGPQVFELSVMTSWKLENGEWCLYFDQNAPLKTPFGLMNSGARAASGANPMPNLPNMPNMASLRMQATISKTSVALTDDNPVQSVTLTNHMAGPIGVTVDSTRLAGIAVEPGKSQVAAGETIEIRFRLVEKGKKTAGAVEITCSPLGQQFEVQVTGN